MNIKLEKYEYHLGKDFFVSIFNMLNLRTLKNLGYFNIRTLKEMFENRKGKRYLFKIIFKNKFVGMITINYEKTKHSWNLAYFIFKKYWGFGIATLAVKKILSFAKKKGIRKINAETFQDNFASSRVLEKNKFKKVNENKKEIFWEKKL